MRVRHGDADVRTEGFQESEEIDPKDPLLPREGTVYVLRVADEYAAHTSSREGAPTFRRYWPVAEKQHRSKADSGNSS